MSLILPPFYFANATDIFEGTTPGTLIGTAVTSGGSANADGTAVSLLPAVAHDIHYLVVGVTMTSVGSATDTAALMDVLVDPAGGSSWSNLIDDLVVGFCPQAAAVGAQNYFSIVYNFPLWIPSGSSLGVQVRCAVASTVFRVGMWTFGNPSRPDMWWCGQKVESLGINAASSKGTDITPGSTTGTFSWTNVGATTSGRYGAIQFMQNGSDNSATGVAYHAQIGISSAKLPGSPTFYWNNTTTEASVRSGDGPIWCDIPQGTQLQVGACCSGTAEVHDVALYGVY